MIQTGFARQVWRDDWNPSCHQAAHNAGDISFRDAIGASGETIRLEAEPDDGESRPVRRRKLSQLFEPDAVLTVT
jgi:hypothetical protein